MRRRVRSLPMGRSFALEDDYPLVVLRLREEVHRLDAHDAKRLALVLLRIRAAQVQEILRRRLRVAGNVHQALHVGQLKSESWLVIALVGPESDLILQCLAPS
jgi:hypothetical protein